MCIIIIKQKGKDVPTEVLKTSARINPHGLESYGSTHSRSAITNQKSISYSIQTDHTLHTLGMQRLVESVKRIPIHSDVETTKMSC